MATAKLFRSGGSQAVRLPKDFRFPGTEVDIRRTRRGVLLAPILSMAERKKRFAALFGSAPDFPLAEPQPPIRASRSRKQRPA